MPETVQGNLAADVAPAVGVVAKDAVRGRQTLWHSQTVSGFLPRWFHKKFAGV